MERGVKVNLFYFESLPSPERFLGRVGMVREPDPHPRTVHESRRLVLTVVVGLG